MATDKQMALDFMKLSTLSKLWACDSTLAIEVLAETFNQIRIEERARCAAIIERYTDESHPGPVQFAARRTLVAIEEE